MVKKRKHINNRFAYNNGTSHAKHPLFRQKLTFGQKASDVLARFGGSWAFIFFFIVVIISWVFLNGWYLINNGLGPIDPFPFTLLNLLLSSLAAFQAPIILMAQNRQAERDRIDAKYDHQVNRKAEREIQLVQKDLKDIKQLINKLQKKKK
ncbi:MAG: DUF1003 domain-containing protein [Nanoarchaeota archaeon]